MRSPIPAVTRPFNRRPATTRRSSSGRPPLVELLARLLEPWRLTEAETIHAIRALRGAIHGFVDLERTGGFGVDLPWRTLTNGCWEFWRRGSAAADALGTAT